MDEEPTNPVLRRKRSAEVLRRLKGSKLASTAAVGAIVGLVAIGYAGAAGLFSDDLTPTAIVDRQEGNMPFPGFRRAHAKGICITGQFRSSGGLQQLSRSEMFEPGAVTPFVGRFSIGGANPTAPDLKAGVRSLALDFRLENGERWRTAMNTPPVLAVRDAQAFFVQIASTAPDPKTGKPDPMRLAAFAEAHPEGAPFRAWQKAYVPSSSFATERYHSINAFLLINGNGAEQPVRWRAEPVLAPLPVAGEDVNALQVDLASRTKTGPVAFRLIFTLAQRGDAINDPSTPWPSDRQEVEAGLIEIVGAQSQLEGQCNAINFDPLILPVGIAPSDDPILHARSGAYAVSYRRRAAENALEGGQ